jgi:small subunit ribosomal protein S20
VNSVIQCYLKKNKEYILANHKSAAKRARQNKVRNENNKWKKSRVRTTIKKLYEAIDGKKADEAKALMLNVQSLLAKLAKTSAIKKATAARLTGRLAKKVSSL